MTQTIGGAIATRDEHEANTPRALVMRYREELTKVLPTHLQSAAEQEAWLRLSIGSLKTGRTTGGEFDLEIAARNNPAAFMQALRKAAGLGLQPGTEQFYLTPRKVKGRLEILGITGYQGIIELMYRAGYTAAVVCEVVREKDKFEFTLGRDERPTHEIDWFGDRGEVIGAYGYAMMHGGVTSRVIVMSEAEIQEVRKRYSQGSDSEYSPWQTNPNAMRLKTIVRRLKAWVPTSVEVRGQGGLPIIPPSPHGPLTSPAVATTTAAALPVGQAPVPPEAQADPTDSDEVVDGELVEEPATSGRDAESTSPTEGEAPPPVATKSTRAASSRPRRPQQQPVDLGQLFTQKGFRDGDDRHGYTKAVLELPNLREDDALSADQVAKVIEALQELDDVKQDGS